MVSCSELRLAIHAWCLKCNLKGNRSEFNVSSSVVRALSHMQVVSVNPFIAHVDRPFNVSAHCENTDFLVAVGGQKKKTSLVSNVL